MGGSPRARGRGRPRALVLTPRAIGLRRAAALSVGVVFGAQLGALLSQRLSGTVIQRLLAVGLLLLGLRLVLSVVL